MAQPTSPAPTVQVRLGQLLARLRAGGGRVTPQRVAILKVAMGGHRSAEEIFDRVRAEAPGVSRATVYKTLETLKALGEVQELEVGAGRAHYDALRPEPHPHVVCPACGRIEDIEVPGFEALAGHAEAQGHRVESLRLEFFASCADCLSKNDSY